MTLAGKLLRAPELLQLGVAADEAREPAPGGRLQAGSHGAAASHLEDLHRFAQPLDVDGAERLDLYEALGQTQRLRAHERGARRRELLHARGQVRRLAHGGVVDVQVAADGAHDDLSRVEPDTDLHVHAVRMARLLRVARHPLLHPQRGVARAHGVILVGDGRAEERHDPVAHHLIDRALVAMDRLHHSFEHRVEDLSCFLGIAVGQ